MKKYIKILRNNWIIIWFIAIAVSAASFIAYAEFIDKFNHTKKVVANQAEANQCFASDYLSASTPTATIINKAAVSGQTSYDIPFKIWNYDPSNAARYYRNVLNYTVYAQLVNENNELLNQETYAENASVAGAIGIKTDGGSYVYFSSASYSNTYGYRISISEPNFTGTKAEHIYYLNFPAAMLDNNKGIYVRLTAEPSESNRDLSPLYAVLSVSGATADLTTGWTGKYNDDTTTYQVSSFDGYNYVISGNGEADITFEWRTDKFEINSFFINDNSITTTTVYKNSEGETVESGTEGAIEWKHFEKHVNSNVVNRYDIQLYMTGNAATDYPDLDTIKSYVAFSEA